GDHAVDALGGGGKPLDLRHRFVGARTGLLDGGCGLTDLAADLFDGGREFFGGAGDGGDVGGGLLGGVCSGDRTAAGIRGDAGNALRCAAHGGGAVVDGADDSADRRRERLGR